MAYSQNQIENTLVERTISFVTGSLANLATEVGTIQIARHFNVKKVSVDQYSEFRLYGEAAARTADLSRSFGDLSFIGKQSKYILGLKLDGTTGLNWFMSPPAVGMNSDVPTTPTIYYYIKNNSGITTAINVTLKVLVLEV